MICADLVLITWWYIWQGRFEYAFCKLFLKMSEVLATFQIHPWGEILDDICRWGQRLHLEEEKKKKKGEINDMIEISN